MALRLIRAFSTVSRRVRRGFEEDGVQWASSAQEAAFAPPKAVKPRVPLPVIPADSPWGTLTPSGRDVFPKDVDKYTTLDFLRSFEHYERYHARLTRECKTFKDFLLIRVKVLRRLGIPRMHRKIIIKFTHRFRMGIWKPKPIPRSIAETLPAAPAISAPAAPAP